ncbi:MAG: TolC family protein [Deltaproteobacteria bacterium]|nr:TolC family protein [Deltaproteobacteria bacterium]
MMRWLSILLLLLTLGVAGTARAGSAMRLGEAFQRAVRQSETLGMKAAEIDAMRARYQQTLGTALPSLNVNATEMIQDTPTGGDETIAGTYMRRSRPEVAVGLRQPLFNGLRELHGLKSAGADRERARHDHARALQALYFDVATAYDTVLRFERELTIQRALRNVLAARDLELHERIRLGKSRLTEALTTEATLAATEAAMEKTRGLVAVAREMLGFLQGMPATEPLVEEPYADAILRDLEGLVVSARARPDVDAAESAARAAKQRVAVEKSGYAPSLDVASNYYPYRVGFQKDMRWDVLFSLKVPVFQGGIVRGKVREAQARHQQSVLAQELVTRQAERETRAAFDERTALLAEHRALARAVTKAKANVDLITEEYRLGLVNNLEVLQALKDLYDRQLEATRAHFEVRRATRELLLAAGALPIDGAGIVQ